MKQYTTPEQTSKLIELEFREPKSKVGGKVIYEPDADLEIEWEYAYSIGELIEKLPPKVGGWNLSIERYWEFEQWHVYYDPTTHFLLATELRDALYNMCVKLKEEGVI